MVTLDGPARKFGNDKNRCFSNQKLKTKTFELSVFSTIKTYISSTYSSSNMPRAANKSARSVAGASMCQVCVTCVCSINALEYRFIRNTARTHACTSYCDCASLLLGLVEGACAVIATALANMSTLHPCQYTHTPGVKSLYSNLFASVYVYIYIHIYTYMHRCICIYIHTHVYIHA